MSNHCFFKKCRFFGKAIHVDCILHHTEFAQLAIAKSRKAIDESKQAIKDSQNAIKQMCKAVEEAQDAACESERALKLVIEHYSAMKMKNCENARENGKIEKVDENQSEQEEKENEYGANRRKQDEREKEIVVKEREHEQKESDLEKQRKRLGEPINDLLFKARKLNESSTSSSSKSSPSSAETSRRRNLNDSYDKSKPIKKSTVSSFFERKRKVANGQNSTPTSRSRANAWPVSPKSSKPSSAIANDSKSNNTTSEHNDAIIEPSQSLLSPSFSEYEREFLKGSESKMRTPEKAIKEEKIHRTPITSTVAPQIKQEKLSMRYDDSSPDIFMSDVIFVEQKEMVYTVPDVTQVKIKPCKSLVWKGDRAYNTPKDSQEAIKVDSYVFEERLRDGVECYQCKLFYDEVAEKHYADAANQALRCCPEKCEGYRERCKRLGKTCFSDNEDAVHPEKPPIITSDTSEENLELQKLQESDHAAEEPEKNDGKVPVKFAIHTKLDELRKRRAKGIPDDVQLDFTPSGFWDAAIPPRQSTPLKNKRKRNNAFNTQEMKILENIYGPDHFK